MSRSGYTDDVDQWSLIKYRGQVASAIRGKRGQRFLRELIAALDAMPVKELIDADLVDEEGAVCALGALGQAKGIDVSSIDPYDHAALSSAFDIAPQLAAEVMYENDDWWRHGSPHDRWQRVREWAEAHLSSQQVSA